MVILQVQYRGGSQMRHSNRWIVAVLMIIVSLQLVACGQTAESPESNPPAKVEPIGQDLNRVILTAEAAKRLGIETAPVSNKQVGGKQREVVPYAAVYYDLNGATWVYTNPEPLIFVRAPITVDSITGDVAVLSKGPPVGTSVVTVGASELYGTETGVSGQ
jgi:hypothetical protein